MCRPAVIEDHWHPVMDLHANSFGGVVTIARQCTLSLVWRAPRLPSSAGPKVPPHMVVNEHTEHKGAEIANLGVLRPPPRKRRSYMVSVAPADAGGEPRPGSPGQ